MQPLRRKLLKGSAAAPLLLTVQPASATARTSVQCMARDMIKNDPKMFESSADEWMRKSVNKLELTVPKSTGGTMTLSNRYFVRSYDGTEYYEITSGTPLLSSYKPGYGVTEVVKGQQLALLKVDKDGSYVSWHWEPKTGQKCTRSCYSSIKPHA